MSQHEDLIARLRVVAYSYAAPECFKAADALAALVAERDALRTHVEQWHKWHAEGEPLFNDPGWGALFHLGKWWGERPWRAAQEQKP